VFLKKFHHRLCLRLGRAEEVFSNFVAHRKGALTYRDQMLLEGLVSAVWQIWCGFCRNVIIASATGCTTKSGTLVPGIVVPLTWERVSYIAICAGNKNPVKNGYVNSRLLKEPTWGDVNKLIAIVNTLKPSNKTQLLTAFGSGLRGPMHMQIVRNANAHWNTETASEITAIRPYYTGSAIRHPSDTLFWIAPSVKDFAFIAWIDDLKLLGEIATE